MTALLLPAVGLLILAAYLAVTVWCLHRVRRGGRYGRLTAVQVALAAADIAFWVLVDAGPWWTGVNVALAVLLCGGSLALRLGRQSGGER